MKDFRIINILVPDHQVIDTVDIYHLPEKHRKLSLRFLSWQVLGVEIQGDMHDSIEDARTAFNLYLHYRQCCDEGRWEDVLDEIYEKGARVNFKPPGDKNFNSPAVSRKKKIHQ
jgi:PAB-dependent poly(A)-specific ribonuclease subunit 2